MMKKIFLRALALSLVLTLLLTSSGMALTLRYPQRGSNVTTLQAALALLSWAVIAILATVNFDKNGKPRK